MFATIRTLTLALLLLSPTLGVTASRDWNAILFDGAPAPVEFQARVTRYTKGYQGRRADVSKPLAHDYRLERPTRVRRITPDVKGDGHA